MAQTAIILTLIVVGGALIALGGLFLFYLLALRAIIKRVKEL